MTSTDLAEGVQKTSEALDAARQELEASRKAVADADASLAAYEDRARSGLSVSAATFGDRRAQVELSRMTLEASEARADAADLNYRAAVAAHAADVIVNDDRVNGSRDPKVTEEVAKLVEKAYIIAAKHYAQRNTALGEVHAHAVKAGLPTATKPVGMNHWEVSDPFAPVSLAGGGLLVNGRPVEPVSAHKAARAMVTKAIESVSK